jgi:hypothetical protein
MAKFSYLEQANISTYIDWLLPVVVMVMSATADTDTGHQGATGQVG